MPKSILSKIISFTVVPVAFYSVQRFSPSPFGSTTLWWLIQMIILAIFVLGRFVYFERVNKRYFIIINLFLIWIIFSLIRGIFMAEMYLDYKTLIIRLFELTIPIFVAFVASNKERLQSILSYFVKYALPFALVVLPFFNGGVWGWYLFPVSFLILFFPLIKIQWKIILVLISFAAILGNLTVRSHVFKYGIPMLILAIYYFRFFIDSQRLMQVARKIIIILPWVLFFLAVSGVFNVFRMKDYIKMDFGEQRNADGEKQQDPMEDSRTFFFIEVLQSAKKYNYWILGRSPARGNDTVVFAGFFEEMTGRSERYKNEANVTNMFTWMGIIGLVLYFLVFYKASYLAISKSNNIYIKLVGLFVTLRWFYSWIEDYSNFGMNDFTIWLMIGACLSDSFRRMNNLEVMFWARGIFEKRYIRYLDHLEKKFPKNMLKLNQDSYERK